MLRKFDLVLFCGSIFQIVDIDGSCLHICNDDFPLGFFVSSNQVSFVKHFA